MGAIITMTVTLLEQAQEIMDLHRMDLRHTETLLEQVQEIMHLHRMALHHMDLRHMETLLEQVQVIMHLHRMEVRRMEVLTMHQAQVHPPHPLQIAQMTVHGKEKASDPVAEGGEGEPVVAPLEEVTALLEAVADLLEEDTTHSPKQHHHHHPILPIIHLMYPLPEHQYHHHHLPLTNRRLPQELTPLELQVQQKLAWKT